MNARFFACGTSFTALSGREDYSLRAPRHTFRTPFRRSQLHCSPTHEATSGAVSLAGKGESVKATSPPLCKRSFHWRLNALPHTPEQVRPTSFLFVDCPSIASPASPIRSEQCRHNALRTLIIRPPLTPMFGQPTH